MKIALIGAPGSGKSAVATKIAKELEGKTKIVDKYVEGLETKTGFAFGRLATIPQNFQVVFDRWTREQTAAKSYDNVITCGTVYETTIYTAIHAHQSQTTEKDMLKHLEAQAAMQVLVNVEQTTLEYDLLFYLPYDPKSALAAGHSYDTLVNVKIPEVLDGYFRPWQSLTGTNKEKVKRAAEVIRAFAKSKAQDAEAKQSAVSGSGEPSKEEPQGE